MYKLWAKKIKHSKIISSITVKNNENLSLNEKRNKCLNELFIKLDLSVPIWLSKHENEFLQFKYVTFLPDDFIDEVDFDKLEVELVDDGRKR